MSVYVVYNPVLFYSHVPSIEHPENPNRIKIIIEHLEKIKDEYNIEISIGNKIFDESIFYTVHSKNYIEKLKIKEGEHWLDQDTYIEPTSFEACKYAVGCVVDATAKVIEKDGLSFAIIRPPGHHAGKNGIALFATSQGFCLVNNVAVVVKQLIFEGIFKKIAIIDIDAHHGGGTQEIFYDTSDVLYISVHQHPNTIYPGTGFPEELGAGKGYGYNINLPLLPYSGDLIFENCLKSYIIPILKQYSPEIIFVSLGFDSYIYDNISQLQYTEKSFYLFFNKIKIICNRIVTVLEGGYTKYNSILTEQCIRGYLDKNYESKMDYEDIDEPIIQWEKEKNEIEYFISQKWEI